MSSRYIPPHLRRKSEAVDQADSSNKTNQPGQENLTRRRLSELKISNDQQGPLYTLNELNQHYGCSLTQSTLRDTFDKRNRLGFVVLFRNANPRWRSDHIIFAHTNIHILPGYEKFKQDLDLVRADAESDDTADKGHTQKLEPSNGVLAGEEPCEQVVDAIGAPSSQMESLPKITQTEREAEKDDIIPVFIETNNRSAERARNVAFHGHFRLTHIDLLRPHSPELVRMLQQKWAIPQKNPNAPPLRERKRDPESWTRSLSQAWAVLKFDTVPKDQSLSDPEIEILPDDEQEPEFRDAVPHSIDPDLLPKAKAELSNDKIEDVSDLVSDKSTANG